ncbi:MAG: hypothetical protein FD153_1614, partial [Rhodospirillaceae bacterium]
RALIVTAQGARGIGCQVGKMISEEVSRERLAAVMHEHLDKMLCRDKNFPVQSVKRKRSREGILSFRWCPEASVCSRWLLTDQLLLQVVLSTCI